MRKLITVMAIIFLGLMNCWPEEKKFEFSKIDLKLLDEATQMEEQMEKKGLVYSDPQMDSYLEKLGEKLVGTGSVPEKVRWKFRVVRDPMINAFCLPNGSIYFTSGLLAMIENEHQLAAVMAHEITHARLRHTYLENRSTRKKMVALHIVSAIGNFAPTGNTWGQIAITAASVSQQMLIFSIFGYSRAMEKEADLEAIREMQSKGYNLTEMVKTFKLMDDRLEVHPIEPFYTDHPRLKERIAYTEDAVKYANIQDVTPEDLKRENRSYLEIAQGVVRENVDLDITSRRPRTALARAQRLVEFDPDNSENIFWAGESYRNLGPRLPRASATEESNRGQKEVRNRLAKYTSDEEEKLLLESSDGISNQQANNQTAETLFQKALQLDPNNANAHRGLGMLYEKEAKLLEAVQEYEQYLKIAPKAIDAFRIQQRLEKNKALANK